MRFSGSKRGHLSGRGGAWVEVHRGQFGRGFRPLTEGPHMGRGNRGRRNPCRAPVRSRRRRRRGTPPIRLSLGPYNAPCGRIQAGHPEALEEVLVILQFQQPVCLLERHNRWLRLINDTGRNEDRHHVLLIILSRLCVRAGPVLEWRRKMYDVRTELALREGVTEIPGVHVEVNSTGEILGPCFDGLVPSV